MNIQNLFPTPVGMFTFGREITEEELAFITEQATRWNEGNTTSLNRKILQETKMTEIRAFIEESLQEYFKTVYNPRNDISLYITQSWANYTKKDEFHHRHAHPNSFVSGVFYPKANREHDKVSFFKDGYQRLDFPPAEYNTWNSTSWWFSVGAGDLILFPSHLQHEVSLKKDDSLRISIAFNTFLKGYVGNDESLTGLYLRG